MLEKLLNSVKQVLNAVAGAVFLAVSMSSLCAAERPNILLVMAGIEYPAEFGGRKVEPPRGRSMLGLLDGSKESIYGDSEFVGGEMANGKWMRQGAFKAVMVPQPYGTGAWKLYNVVTDPGEADDLSSEMPGKLESLKAAWDRYAKDVGVILAE